MTGIKMVNVAAPDPRTGQFNLKPVENSKKILPQSCTLCFPTKLCMGKETAKNYQEVFREMFEMRDSATQSCYLPTVWPVALCWYIYIYIYI